MRKKVLLGIVGVVALSTMLAGVASAQQYPTTPQPTQPAPSQTPSQPAPTPAQQPTTPAPSQPTTPTPTTPSQQPTTPGQPLPAGQYPNVSNLKPFSPEANFMSLAGYLRYLVYQSTNQWLTRAEAERVVRQQRGI